MSSSQDGVLGEKPDFTFHAFDHLVFWVGNAKQSASYYCIRFGFKPVAYKGLETGCRTSAHHVLIQGKILLEFVSPLQTEVGAMGLHQATHGDGVRDVAFLVDDVKAVVEHAVKKGAQLVRPIEVLTEEGVEGRVVIATVKSYGDTVHSFVQREGKWKNEGLAQGAPHNADIFFLPGYQRVTYEDPLTQHLPSVGLINIDHCVGNQPDKEMLPVVEWFVDKLSFHRFWSVDDKDIYTEFSSLRSIVVADYHENVKMPINEPAVGKRKSQIQEYVEFYGGAGVQHIALRCDDIIHAVNCLRNRGVRFLTIPPSYYDLLRAKLARSPVKVLEDIDELQRLNILIDYDDHGYLLQIFTSPVEDRPTLFFEIIQRRNHSGFGAGNFKSLFESIELEQAKRGNLV